MPRGKRNLNTVNGIDQRVGTIDKAIGNLQSEISILTEERNSLMDARKSIVQSELLDMIYKSGKSPDEVKTALGL
jgi:archaellum component FlaC